MNWKFWKKQRKEEPRQEISPDIEYEIKKSFETGRCGVLVQVLPNNCFKVRLLHDFNFLNSENILKVSVAFTNVIIYTQKETVLRMIISYIEDVKEHYNGYELELMNNVSSFLEAYVNNTFKQEPLVPPNKAFKMPMVNKKEEDD